MKRTFAFLVAMGLALTACTGGGDASTSDMTLADSGGEEAALQSPDEGGADGDFTQVDVALASDREVIRRANLQLHASNTRSAFDEITALVQTAGGFVATATVYPTASEEAQPEVTMTLRVPSDQLSATLAAIKGTADEVVSETQGAEDVTEQFIDLEARLTNLQALEVELRALLTEVREQDNADPAKLLTVFNEVSSVRGEIEQIQGQLNYLSDKTSLATVEVEITQTPSAAPLVDEPWSPAETSREAASSLVAGLQNVADWAINFAIYVLPMLVLIVGPLAVIGLFVYRRFFRRPPTDPTPAGA
ncbi:MAG TPA: DUF4349 domain-containing protein [Acidimicrobiia bacterium]|nr:DUF4349 domain-containing protein [Acidimicrobiia bacterium]